MPEYICIGVPYFIGERIETRTEVYSIQKSGFAEDINAEWVNITPDFAAYDNPVIAVNRALARTIAAHPDKTPIVFASDCVSAFGCMKGLESQQPAVVWFDAHGDFNTNQTTPSGFLGGMPLAMLVGLGEMTYMQGIGLAPIPETDVTLIDARDLDPEEADLVAGSSIKYLKSVTQVSAESLPDKPLYIHFDTDVVRLEDMPGMAYPAAGGPTLKDSAEALQHVTENHTIAGILFGLWDDGREPTGKSLRSTLELAKTFIASNA